jgi:hypothetical protein
VAPELAEDGRRRERAERRTALRVESLDRLQEADRRDLDEILVGDSAVAVTVREVMGDTEVPLDEIVAQGAIPGALIREEVGIAVGHIHGPMDVPIADGAHT